MPVHLFTCANRVTGVRTRGISCEDVLHAGLVPRCSFSDKQLHRRQHEVPAMPPRVSVGPMAPAERCDTLRARTCPQRQPLRSPRAASHHLFQWP